jgi:Endoribonuclease YbeY
MSFNGVKRIQKVMAERVKEMAALVSDEDHDGDEEENVDEGVDGDEDDRGVSGAMAVVRDPETRICMLVVHGMLHLVGYDHK